MTNHMKRAIGVMAVLVLVTVGAGLIWSEESPGPTSSGCPAGWTSWKAFEGMHAGSPAVSIEEAVRREFQDLSLRPTPGAIEEALVEADGDTTRRSTGTSWCAPDDG
jgi:hypothetical protein